MEFRFTVDQKNTHAIVHFSGRLIEKVSAEPLLEQFPQLLKDNGNKVIFDMQKLEYMNSSGLNVMVNFLTKARNMGGDIAIGNVNDKVSQLLVITKLNTLFKVHDSVDEAVASIVK